MKIIGTILLILFTFFIVKKDKSGYKNYPIQNLLDSLKVDTLVKGNPNFFLDSTEIEELAKDTFKTKTIYGLASFYSRSLEGSETATLETFHHDELTAASNRFKLNTWVRVTRIKNGKSIIVRINDRMHPRMDRKGRIVDLTIRGARSLGFLKTGVTKVKVETVLKGTLK